MICKNCNTDLQLKHTPRTRQKGTKEQRKTVLKCNGCGKSHNKEHIRILRRF